MAKKSKTNKKILIIIIAVTAVMVCLTGIFAAVIAAQQGRIRNGLYKGLEWGVSKDKIQKALTGNYTDNSDKNCILNKVSNYEDIAGLTGTEIYDYENGLNEVSVILTLGNDSRYSGSSVSTAVDNLSKIYDKRFGNHTEKTYSYQWTTKKSVIELNFIADNMILVIYKDINAQSGKNNK